ncbi:MAG: hypothetical protein ACXABY_09570 [Candidatus Thorarchaeota archaeon]|jgi:hypothetical protein
MVTKPSPDLFFPNGIMRWRANILKTNKSVPLSGRYEVINVSGQPGLLGQITANLASQTSVRLQVEVDNRFLVNHTPADVEGTGAGKLALEIPNAVGSILQTTKSAASNYSISFIGIGQGIPFEKSCLAHLINDTATAVDVQALYATWAVLGRSKI